MATTLASSSRATMRVLWLGAAALLVFGLVEMVVLGVDSRAMGLRAIWAALTATAAVLYPRVKRRTRTALLVMLGLASPGLFGALLELRGDLTGVSFAFFLATPMVFAILLRGETSTVVAASVSTLVTGVALFRAMPGASGGVAAGAIASVAAGAIAVYASSLYARMTEFAEQLHRERLAAVEARGRAALASAEVDRAALLSQVAAGLAHEINNPLGILTSNLSFLDTLATPSPSADDLAELPAVVADANTAAMRISGVVRRLEALAPPPSKERPAADIVAAVHALVSELPRSPGVRTDVRTPTAAIEVAMPEHQLRRVLQQVLQGAMGALETPNGLPTPELDIEVSAEAADVVVSIRDNARVPRSPAKSASDIRARGADSGLGLMLAGESMRQCGGSIEALPTASGGEQVVLRFPRATSA